ncbi:hypothetical protein [Hyphomonas atlantica]|uniref:Uncharacterized protein n=1 Tax=Hyphomonas atlantica TaxID=1280948 RepID=A0A059EAG5_9PROT|nr:hypothetical protein [Hyphomonas atlantica]KCZ64600.1 hypothetical protein HY36_12200 [Hyphomonas atlantica]
MAESQIKADQKQKSLGVFSTLAVGVVLSLYAIVIGGIYFGVRDGWLAELWTNLEGDGRANVISSMVTALGLLSSAVILPFVFKDRISSLSDMVDRTERDLKDLSNTTNDKLDDLTSRFKSQLDQFQAQTVQKADEGQELIEGLYAAVSLLLGQGIVTDSNHARQIVKGLWERAKLACREKLQNKKYMRQTTKDEVRKLKMMSADYFSALVANGVISTEERDMLVQLRGFRYAQSPPTPTDFPLIGRLQEAIDRFSQSDENGNIGETN